MKRRIMIVDDEEGILQALRRLLRGTPCTYGKLSYELETEVFVSPAAALARAREAAFDIVLSDYRMPAMDGVEFLRRVRELQPNAARLILSGHADRVAIERAFDEVHIYRFIAKPWNEAVLLSAIAEALNHRDLLLENGAGGAAAG